MATNEARGGDGSAQNENAKSWTISGLDGLRPICRTLEFTVDFNVFNDLVEASYRHLCKTLPEYSQNVSLGMYSYYIGVALWYRLYAIYDAQGGDSWSFAAVTSQFPCGLILPKSICRFLDVIGDFVDPNGCQWKFVFIDWEVFDQMSDSNFYDYMGAPAPEILIETLQNELDVIVGEKDPGDQWKLDGIDFENCPEDQVFTKNVCGYFSPPEYGVDIESPIGKQLSTALEKLRKFSKSDQRACDWIYTNTIAYITNYHENQCKGYPMERYSNESNYGSVLQMGFVEFPNKNDVQGFSPAMLPDSLSNLIPVFRLRVKRDPQSLDAYPYEFTTINDVPDSWPAELNSNFNFGSAKKRLNFARFSTGIVNRKLVVAEYVKSF